MLSETGEPHTEVWMDIQSREIDQDQDQDLFRLGR